MPAFTDVVLTDQAAVNHTYTPSVIDQNGVARWYKSATVLDARWQMSQQVRQPINGSPVARVNCKLVTPLMDAVDTTKKIGDLICNVEFVLPRVSTETQRRQFQALASAMLAHTEALYACQYLQHVY